MRRFSILTVIAAIVFPATALGQIKRPLDHDAYDIWMGIENQAISNDGRWVLYALVPQDGDAELRVHSLISNVTYSIPRGRSPRFSADSRFVVTLISPELEASRQARRGKAKPGDQPMDSLGILNLANGEVFRIERVKSYELPEDAGGWVAFLLDEAASQADTAASHEEPEPTEGGAEREEKKDKKTGTTLVLRNLASGEETIAELVTEYTFAENGRWVAYAVSTKDGVDDGAYVLDLETDDVVTLAKCLVT